MARMPRATWDGEHSPGIPMQRYDIVCIHTIVGRAPAHAAHLSTFMDGRPPHQSRDTRFRSAANLDGNHRVLAIENEDTAPGKGVPGDVTDWPPLTDSQLDDCAEFLAFAHVEHGVPLQLCPDSRPGSRGLAYHRQGCDGNFGEGTAFRYAGRVAGGERWSSAAGKVCPTDARIAQLPTILERAKALVAAQEDDMFTEQDRATLNQIQQGQKTMRENVRKRDVALRSLVTDALAELRKDAKADRVVVGKLTAIEAALAEDVDGA